MSSPPHSPGCAVRADGTLKEAHEIEFFNDPSDDVPLPSSAASASAPANLDSFITARGSGLRGKPAAMIGGARRSTRAPHPSAKVRDSGPSLSTVPAKRTAGPTTAKAPVLKHARLQESDNDVPALCEVSDEESDDDDDDNDGDDEEVDRVRLMGESDRKVSVSPCVYLFCY